MSEPEIKVWKKKAIFAAIPFWFHKELFSEQFQKKKNV